jgi:hypothetical protein
VLIHQPPRLSQPALDLLKSKGGVARFREKYGDFFVCGYELGAEAGACLSADTSNQDKTQITTLTVEVKVLIWSHTETHQDVKVERQSSSKLVFCGYSTLHNMSDKFTVENRSAYEIEQLKRQVSTYMAKISSVNKQALATVEQLDLKTGQHLPLSFVGEICKNGLAIQLMLSPYARLNEYVALVAKGTAQVLKA